MWEINSDYESSMWYREIYFRYFPNPGAKFPDPGVNLGNFRMREHSTVEANPTINLPVKKAERTKFILSGDATQSFVVILPY